MRRAAPLLRELWRALNLGAAPTAALTLGVVAYAGAHAAVAFSAGSLAQMLGSGPLALRRGFSESLGILLYVGLGSAFVKGAAGTALAYAEQRIASRAGTHLRERLLASLLAGGARLPAPHVVSALGVRVSEVEHGVSRGLLTWTRAALQLLPLGGCLVALSPRSALLGVAVLAPFAVVLAVLRARSRRATESSQDLAERLARGVEELVRHADLFRTYGAGRGVLAEVVAAGDRAGRAAASAEARRAALSGGNEVLGALAILGIAQLAPRAGWDPGAWLLPFATVFFMAYRPLRDLGDARTWITRGEVALGALEQALGEVGALGRGAAPLTPVSRRPTPAIELAGYGARSRGPTTDLRLDPGEIVCLVGPTGAGKSTLLRAMLGLEEEAGLLAADGRPLTGTPVGPEFRPFAWVPQDAPLVTGTLTDNVALLGASRPAAREALEQLGAGLLLDALKDAPIGPGGRPLSGGERRLVALARGLASGLPVLLLDEPTEGLDPDATRTVLDAIRRLRGTRSVVIVTHREEVMRIADRIVPLGTAYAERPAAE